MKTDGYIYLDQMLAVWMPGKRNAVALFRRSEEVIVQQSGGKAHVRLVPAGLFGEFFSSDDTMRVRLLVFPVRRSCSALAFGADAVFFDAMG